MLLLTSCTDLMIFKMKMKAYGIQSQSSETSSKSKNSITVYSCPVCFSRIIIVIFSFHPSWYEYGNESYKTSNGDNTQESAGEFSFWFGSVQHQAYIVFNRPVLIQIIKRKLSWSWTTNRSEQCLWTQNWKMKSRFKALAFQIFPWDWKSKRSHAKNSRLLSKRLTWRYECFNYQCCNEYNIIYVLPAGERTPT